MDSLCVVDLSAPWISDYGIATDRKAGSQSAGTSFTQTANALVEFTLTTRPSANYAEVAIRQQDASNYWGIRVDSTGALSLQEVVAGVATQRATAVGVVSSGHRIVAIADGTTIRCISNNVVRWTYSSATNFQTATAGSVVTLGTGGVVSDVIAWPRTVTLPNV